jgi:hypothetical protein
MSLLLTAVALLLTATLQLSKHKTSDLPVYWIKITFGSLLTPLTRITFHLKKNA